MGQRVDAHVEAAMRRAKATGVDGWISVMVGWGPCRNIGGSQWVHTLGSTNIADWKMDPESRCI